MEKALLVWKSLYAKFAVASFDLLAIPLAWYLAYWLRYNMQPFPSNLSSSYSVAALLLMVVIQVGCYGHFKVNRGLWRFSSLNDVLRILQASISATLIAIPLLYLCSLLNHIPRSIFPLYCLLLVSLLCGARILLRSYLDGKKGLREQKDLQRVMVIGAGRAGEGLVRDLKRSKLYQPIGVVDDNAAKRGLEIHGVRVLGTIRELPALVSEHQIDLIFIAIPSANSALMRTIVRYCESCNLPFRTLPSLQALVSGQVYVNALREVKLEDLLGRDQVEIDRDLISKSLEGKRVLVTGGGGSIGSELCRQIMRFAPEKLLILDNSEFNLYNIHQILQQEFPLLKIELALASVADALAVMQIFSSFKPEIVFHAAAFKHVPMLEEQVRVAVKNNVLGTQNVAMASVAANVSKFVLISTDKAVNPTNVMGTTKRVAEIFCQNLNPRVATEFITVRFGNVLGSVGSVVPLFQKQLEQGGPLTVTHPDIERFFMTIPEACQLILQSMVHGKGGEIFVLDMGEPVKISYLARQMIRLAGKEPGIDIEIQYTGLRPGEKLYEELFHDSERLEKTQHEKLFRAQFRAMDWTDLEDKLEALKTACAAYDSEALLHLLKQLVPEFKSASIPFEKEEVVLQA